MFNRIIGNTRKPESNFWGRMMLRGMNLGHNAMAVWCIDRCIKPQGNEDILDVGCGGGRNIAHFLKRTEGRVYGIDRSKSPCDSTEAGGNIRSKCIGNPFRRRNVRYCYRFRDHLFLE